MNNFWKNYQYLCNKKGVSVYEAATANGVTSASSVSYWRKGSTPHVDTLNKLRKYFDVTYDLVYQDIELLESSPAPSHLQEDPLYSDIMKLNTTQRTLVKGFIAGLLANQRHPL